MFLFLGVFISCIVTVCCLVTSGYFVCEADIAPSGSNKRSAMVGMFVLFLFLGICSLSTTLILLYQ